mgnify:CR=1 FL=1
MKLLPAILIAALCIAPCISVVQPTGYQTQDPLQQTAWQAPPPPVAPTAPSTQFTPTTSTPNTVYTHDGSMQIPFDQSRPAIDPVYSQSMIPTQQGVYTTAQSQPMYTSPSPVESIGNSQPVQQVRNVGQQISQQAQQQWDNAKQSSFGQQVKEQVHAVNKGAQQAANDVKGSQFSQDASNLGDKVKSTWQDIKQSQFSHDVSKKVEEAKHYFLGPAKSTTPTQRSHLKQQQFNQEYDANADPEWQELNKELQAFDQRFTKALNKLRQNMHDIHRKNSRRVKAQPLPQAGNQQWGQVNAAQPAALPAQAPILY